MSHRVVVLLSLVARYAAGQTIRFDPPQSFPTGTIPISAVSGDFNKDGKPDLAVFNQADRNILVLLGKGDGTFQLGATLTVQDFPSSLAVGDVNNDGNPDLIVASNISSSLSVLLGRGDGTFQRASNSPTAQFPRNIAVGDFNGDGKLDLAISAGPPNGATQLAIYRGQGDGTFLAGTIYSTVGNADAIQVGDLNGDGRLDLVVEEPAFNFILVFLGDGNGQFNPLPPALSSFGSPGIGGLMALVDLNGDHRPDLIYGNSTSNSLSIALGKGDGTFTPSQSLTLSSGGPSFAVGDFNGDGKPDLAVVYMSSASVSVFAGNGNGTFQPEQVFPGGSVASLVLTADLDGDGRSDLVTTTPFLSAITVLRSTTASPPPGPPLISLSTSQLKFTLNPDGSPPPPQPLSITNVGGGTLAWTATSNVPWIVLLNVPPSPSPFQTSGTAPSSINVVIRLPGLSPGVNTGTISVTGEGAANAPQMITVILSPPGPASPPPSLRTVQNAASYDNKVAQGSLFVVSGVSLGPEQLSQAPANSLPLQLSGTSVQVAIGGAVIACPMAYTSASRIGALLPSGTPLGQGALTVTFNGQNSYPAPIRVVITDAGIYSTASSGMGTGNITGLDYVNKTMSQPAKPGEVVIAWGTGLGPINGNDAVVAPTPPFPDVEVFVGNLPAKVISAGRTGCCAGLDQIAFEVPDAPKGCFVPVSIRVAGGILNNRGSVSNFVTLPLSQSGEPCSMADPGLPIALVSKASSGQPVPVGVLAIGTANILSDLSPTLSDGSATSSSRLAAQLSTTLHVAVPEADVVRVLKAYRSGDMATVRKVLARYARVLKNNPAARKLLRSAADLSQQEAAVAAFGVGSGIGLVGPEFASDFPPAGTCTIIQNTPTDMSARISGLDAGPSLTINGPGGQKTMTRTANGQYSVVLGTGPLPNSTTPGLYTISGTGGSDIGAFSVSLNVANPLIWTNKSGINSVDRTRPLTVTWSGGAGAGHVLIGGTVKSADSPGVFLCAEDIQKGTFTIPQFILSALPGGYSTTLFIAPHPFDNPVSIPGLDLVFVADASSDSRSVAVQ